MVLCQFRQMELSYSAEQQGLLLAQEATGTIRTKSAKILNSRIAVEIATSCRAGI